VPVTVTELVREVASFLKHYDRYDFMRSSNPKARNTVLGKHEVDQLVHRIS